MAVERFSTSEASESGLSGTVLVVDDEPHLVGMYASMLEDIHSVHTATSGEDALTRLSENIDVVLLDRRMPELSGDEVLKIIRDEGYECRVAMITSVDPDMDIFELPFDGYLVKPVRQEDLREFVENLLLRSEFSSKVQESMAVSAKLVALESQFSDEELSTHEEYQALRARKQELEAANEERIAELMDRGDTGLVYRDLLGGLENQ